jgi:hypothetical protein
MENFQKPNPNVAQSLSQPNQPRPQQEQKPQAQPQSENAKLVQELKKLLRKIATLEKREKSAKVAFDKTKKELDEIGAEKVKYAELLKKFDLATY